MIKFTVYGEPTAQGRPKFTTTNGHAKAYDPDKSKSYKERVYYEALKVKPKELLTGPIKLTLTTYRSIPKSLSKKKNIAAQKGEIRPITKPDCSNICKGVEDALKGVIWKDDSQIVELVVHKFYSTEPRVDISINEVRI